MQLYYTTEINDETCLLGGQEAQHCLRVMRHIAGDMINVTDGKGNMYLCRILPHTLPEEGKSNKRERNKESVACRIISATPNFGAHNYQLTMAVAPTKNMERFEWFLEKSTEIGLDKVVPIITSCSERRSINQERLEKIIVSAAKQSLKGKFPEITSPVAIEALLKRCEEERESLKLVAYCGEATKLSINEAIAKYKANLPEGSLPKITILIGPEGDFTAEEINLALACGFTPIHLGGSRLRTETAAVLSTAAAYLNLL